MATDDRPSSFQPDKPHPQTKGTGGTRRTIFVVAAAVALMVIMVLAIGTPRLFGSDPLYRWLLTLGSGALAFAVVVGIGFVRRSRR